MTGKRLERTEQLGGNLEVVKFVNAIAVKYYVKLRNVLEQTIVNGPIINRKAVVQFALGAFSTENIGKTSRPG